MQNKNLTIIPQSDYGLSYLNYAKLGSDRGLNDPEKNYDTGIGFIMSALEELADSETENS